MAGFIRISTWGAEAGKLAPEEGPSVNYQAPASSGEYTITLTDKKTGNSKEATVKVYEAISLTPEVATVEIGEEASFVIQGGKKPYTASPSKGNAIIEDEDTLVFIAPSEEGKVTITVKDSLGQEIMASVSVIASTPLVCSPKTITLSPSQDITDVPTYFESFTQYISLISGSCPSIFIFIKLSL